jgi:GH24 family phage-related lysozyme (muramidase)
MFNKVSYIKKIGPNKFRVFSESGKNMGTYSSRGAAKKRLSQIEYFKRKGSILDISFSKKTELLRSTSIILNDLGLKKEASFISDLTKNFVFRSILLLSGLGGLGYLSNDVAKEITTDKGISDELLDSREFRSGTSLEQIIKEIYGNSLSKAQEKSAIEIIIAENKNLKFINGKVQLFDDESPALINLKYPNIEKIKTKIEEVVFAKDLKESSEEIEETEEKFDFVPAKNLSFSKEGNETSKNFEDFKSIPYNAKGIPLWPKGLSTTKQDWTVGYGHKLIPEEISKKYIKLSDGKIIHYWNGISKEEAEIIWNDDLKTHSIYNIGISKDEEISKGLYDALTDMSFNMGIGNLTRFVQSIRDHSGNLSTELFSKEIPKWTHSKKQDRKGILVRAICRLLIANEILIPENPKDAASNKVYPSKDVLLMYFKNFLGKDFSDVEEEKLLKKLSANPPKNSEDFLDIISSFR